MLRVLYVLGHGALGGIERHVQALAGCIREQGVEPSVCVLMGGGPVSEQMERDGVRVYTLGARSGHDPALAWRFPAVLREARPDVVHCHESRLLPGLCMRLLPGVPLVHSAHCSLTDGPSMAMSRVVWALVGGAVDRVLPVSQATGRQLTRFLGIGPRRMEVVYNGLDLKDLRRRAGGGRPGGRRVVGGMGRLAAQKDWGAFLETARCLCETRQDVEFVVAGDGPLRRGLQERGLRMGMNGRLRWLGFRADALDLMGSFDVLLMTSRHEELPTTLLEAFAVGTPVVGFLPRGGVGEVLGLSRRPAASFLAERSPAALAEAVGDLLDHPEKAQAQADEGRRVVEEHFDMARIAAQVSGIYRAVLTKRRRA